MAFTFPFIERSDHLDGLRVRRIDGEPYALPFRVSAEMPVRIQRTAFMEIL